MAYRSAGDWPQVPQKAMRPGVDQVGGGGEPPVCALDGAARSSMSTGHGVGSSRA